MMTVELNMLHWRNLTSISWTDFSLIGMINSDAAALFVRMEDFKDRWADPADLLNWIRQNPGQLQASGTATGGIWHLALAGLLENQGLRASDVHWIPMNGAGPSLQELVSGGLDLVCCSLPEATTLLQAGEVACLVVMAAERVNGHGEIPTLQEFGISWTSAAWRGLGLPRGTPSHIVDRYVAVTEEILQGKLRVSKRTFPELMQSQGFEMSWQPEKQFESTLAELDLELGRLLRDEAFRSVSRGPIPPYAVPGLLLLALTVVLTGLTLRVFRERKGRPSGVISPDHYAVLRILEVLVLIGLFVLLVEEVGFVLMALLMLGYLLLRNGVSFKRSLLIPLVLIPLVYQIFANFLRVPLPRGLVGW
jgi:tripartite-type tricarboxylate transporter receptor subunit TctC